MTSEPLLASLEPFIKAARGKKAQEIIVLDVREMTSLADAFIICSGRSNRQVTAIADHIKRTLKKQAIKPLNIEGTGQGHWVLLDYGHVIIHVFYEETRRFYDLEGLWAEAQRFEIEAAATEEEVIDSSQPFRGREIIID